MKKISKFWLILLIFVSLIPLFDLFQSGLPITHDGQDHVARIANFYQSLTEGNIVPRWAANLNWGFGHPILMFLYPLPSYIVSLFHFLNLSLVDSTKIVFGLGFVLSGIFMYLWIGSLWGKEAGFVSGLFYMFAPYRFVNLYVRGAIGENLAFVWLPLVCYFAFKLSRKLKWRYVVGGSLSLAAMVLSHNALSLMFLPLILGYMAYLIFCSKKKLLSTVYYLLSTVFGFLLSAFFWFPAFFEGKYTLRDIVTSGEYLYRFRSFKDFLYSPWGYGGTDQLSVQIGILHWLAFILGFYTFFRFFKKKNKNWILTGGLIIGFVATLFLLLEVSLPIWQAVTILQKFQFPWRFLSIMVFIPAVLAGGFISLWPAKKKTWLAAMVVILLLLINRNYWQAKGFLYKDESFYSGVYASTTDTGESSPRWSVRFMERYPEAPMEVIDGEAEIEVISRSTTRHVYDIKTEILSRLVENTLYFPGWDILVDDKLTEIEFQDPAYRGLITFNLPAGEYQVTARFRETRLRLFADLVSLGGIIGLMGFGVIILTERKNYRKFRRSRNNVIIRRRK